MQELLHSMLGAEPGSDEREVFPRQAANWLETGELYTADLLVKHLRKFLEDRQLRGDHLTDEWVCRLVRRDQLRYDPSHQAAYQLSPGHQRQMDLDAQLGSEEPTVSHGIEQLQNIRLNQAVFWSLAPALQSAIAMFDSDLGRKTLDSDREELLRRFASSPEGVGQQAAKELLEIEAEPDQLFEGFKKATLDARGLNTFSPMRYWAPRQTFARSVFHMLFWQPLATGFDLYGRPFPGESSRDQPLTPEVLRRRADFYCVAINRFQSSAFRITNYADILSLLLDLGRRIERSARRISKSRTQGSDLGSVPARLLVDITFGSSPTLARWATAHFFDDQPLTPPSNWSVECKFDFQGRGKVVHELAARYLEDDETETLTRHLLLMIRDRILELLSWSSFQREIRSLGTVPIDWLCRVVLPDDLGALVDLLSSKDDSQLSEKIMSGEMDELVELEVVYDRRNNKVLDESVSLALWNASKRATEDGERHTYGTRAAPASGQRPKAETPEPNRLTGSCSPHCEDAMRAYTEMVPLNCLWPMIWYYRGVRDTIRCLARDEAGLPPAREGVRWGEVPSAESWFNEANQKSDHFAARLAQVDDDEPRILRMEARQMRLVQTYIDTDLLNYALEFYLQRKRWAVQWPEGASPTFRKKFHEQAFNANPLPYLVEMVGGFGDVRRYGPSAYTFDDFLGDSHAHFGAIYSHLVSINRSIASLHYHSTLLSLGSLSDVARSEILHLTRELDRVMMGLMAAIHLQPRDPWQRDLSSFLISTRSDAARLLDTLPRYYQAHRLRLIPGAGGLGEPPPHVDVARTMRPHLYPVSSLPDHTGEYMDFLHGYQLITQHAFAVMTWSIRLMSLWYFVPRRIQLAVSPVVGI